MKGSKRALIDCSSSYQKGLHLFQKPQTLKLFLCNLYKISTKALWKVTENSVVRAWMLGRLLSPAPIIALQEVKATS